MTVILNNTVVDHLPEIEEAQEVAATIMIHEPCMLVFAEVCLGNRLIRVVWNNRLMIWDDCNVYVNFSYAVMLRPLDIVTFWVRRWAHGHGVPIVRVTTIGMIDPRLRHEPHHPLLPFRGLVSAKFHAGLCHGCGDNLSDTWFEADEGRYCATICYPKFSTRTPLEVVIIQLRLLERLDRDIARLNDLNNGMCTGDVVGRNSDDRFTARLPWESSKDD